eukprot:1133381-Pelagomonas_calceolata.AAC.1
MSELVHDLISSRMSYKDDRSLHESELCRKADARKHNRLEVIVRDMRVWLSSEKLCHVDHGCQAVSGDAVS